MNQQASAKQPLVFGEGREEYVRRARESCLMNYYGDKIQSREKILSELEIKKQKEESKKLSPSESGTVIPFMEGRNRNTKNKEASTSFEKMKTKESVSEKIDADYINRILAKDNKNDMLSEEIAPTGDTTRLPDLSMLNMEQDESLVPSSEDILRMSGIPEETSNTIHNEHVREYTNTYHNNIASSNFVTSIRNAAPEEEKLKNEETEEKSFRTFTIRCICAFLLLATVIILDKMQITYKGFQVEEIYERIVSSELFDQVGEYMETISLR